MRAFHQNPFQLFIISHDSLVLVCRAIVTEAGTGSRSEDAPLLDRRRNMSHRIIAAFGLALVLVACATTGNYDKMLQTWIGAPIDELVASWGPPDSSHTATEGRTVIKYVHHKTVVTVGSTYSFPGSISASVSSRGTVESASTTFGQVTTPTYDIHSSCITSFSANSTGIIDSWEYKGKSCVWRPPK